MTSFRAPAARLTALAWALAATWPAMAANVEGDVEGDAPITVVGHREDIDARPTQEMVASARLAETTNLVDAEDSLRYLPSLLVRKRHVGDTQAPLATRTSGVGASARSLIYVDGVLLSALIGNNNSNASPRWGMVSPEEIDQVEVLYGPFAAGYPGNSIGAVVNISTRVPERLEASVSAATSIQTFDQYATHGIFPAWQLAATVGDRIGRFGFFLSANHVDSHSQPLAYATIARPAAAGTGGVPVTGAIAGRSRTGAPIYILGASGLEQQQQDNLKARLTFDAGPARISYVAGLFLNDTSAAARTYLSQGVYAGAVRIDGRAAAIPASAFSSNVYKLDERHWMHALTLEGGARGGVEWRAIASLYDYARDRQRLPAEALPAAREGGAGSILRLDGTGWRTFDLDARWHGFAGGVHYDLFELESRRYATADWLGGREGALTQVARGRTRTLAAWAEGRADLAPRVTLTLGGRYEAWRADRGFNFSLAPALSVAQPELSRGGFSPKANLAWRPSRHVSLTLSAGQAYRFPTVSELYQAVATGPTVTVPDPRLAPERARSEELAAQWHDRKGKVRLSLFNEAIKDALVSQSAALVPGSTTLFSFVQNIPRVRTRGLELAFDRRDLLVPGLDLQGSLTLADPRIVRDPALPAAEGKDIPQVPRRRGTLVATWHAGEAASFTLAGRYASRSWATIDNSDSVGRTWQGFQGYVVVDTRALFRVGKHWEAAVGIENLGNKRFFLFHPFPGRTFTGELTWRW
jgi:iron complex outermembrane receptor protein